VEPSRAALSYSYLVVLGVLIALLNFALRGYTEAHQNSVIEVIYFVGAATCLAFIEVRLERGRLSLSALANGPAAVLLNPLNATLVGLATGFAMARRPRWTLIANAAMTASITVIGAAIGAFLQSSTGSLAARLATVLAVSGASLVIVSLGLSLRSGESLLSIAMHNFTRPFLLAYGYFTLASLLISYLVDGSPVGYVLASIVFVLALALTDTIAGRRLRRVLESELSDADRHLFHSRAVGSVAGLSGAAAGAGTIVSTYLIGIVADRFSFKPILITASMVPLLAAVLVVALVRNTAESGRGLVKVV